jgi:hypothetical protein
MTQSATTLSWLFTDPTTVAPGPQMHYGWRPLEFDPAYGCYGYNQVAYLWSSARLLVGVPLRTYIALGCLQPTWSPGVKIPQGAKISTNERERQRSTWRQIFTIVKLECDSKSKYM